MTPLIWIRQWDVRWQDQYRFQTPMFLPKGTTLRMRFTYDNSAANPRNPHRPPRRVVWGPHSTDEMGALWVEVVPRRTGDARVLTRDYFQRALVTDIANAEMQVRVNPRDSATHNRLAIKYLQAGRTDEARAELEAALALEPEDAEAMSNLGTVLQGQGRGSDATRYLRDAVRLAPKDDRVHFNLANSLHAAGQAEEAIREYRTAIALEPENADAHFNLGVLLGPKGRLDEAIVHLRRAIDIRPRNADAHRNLAIAYGLQGKLDEAIEHARAAVRIQPDAIAMRQQLENLLAARKAR